MSNLKELFKEIKEVFVENNVDLDEKTEEVTSEVEENVEVQKFEDIVLADGTVAQIEPEVTVGAAVVVEVEGELLPAPDGVHELSDGREIKTESGVIVDVVEAEEEVEQVVEDELGEDTGLTEDQKREARKIIESVITEKHFIEEPKLQDFEKDFESMVEKYNSLEMQIASIRQAYEKVVDLLEILIERPEQTPVKAKKSGFQRVKTNKRNVLEHLKK